MLYINDMLKASADREMVFNPESSADAVDKLAAARSDDIKAGSEHSRSPAAMRRQTVRADLSRMMRTFGVQPDNLPLYQDEVAEAEYACALCQQVGRCRAWSAKGCWGDAPRLFCANAALFEEITPDPLWSETAPGRWHIDARTSPLLRLLASECETLAEAPPRLGARKLESFIRAASAIDDLLDHWSPRLEAADHAGKAAGQSADLDAAIDNLFDLQDGLGKAEFARILQVALCDPWLAKCLCHLHDRSQQTTLGLGRSRFNKASRDA